MRQSETIAELATALAKFQGAVEAVKKDAPNPFFKSKYADLPAMLEVVRKPLEENGLSFVQMPIYKDGITLLVTRIMHASGQWLEGEWPLLAAKNDQQGLGSAATYARRYSLQAALGLSAIDDDGEAAHGRGNAPSAQPQQRQPDRSPAPAKVPDAEREEARKLMKLINGEIARCQSPEDVDLVLNDNAGDIERVRKVSEAGKTQIIANADKQRVALSQKGAA